MSTSSPARYAVAVAIATLISVGSCVMDPRSPMLVAYGYSPVYSPRSRRRILSRSSPELSSFLETTTPSDPEDADDVATESLRDISAGFSISWKAALVFNVMAIIFLTALLLLLAFWVRKRYQRRKLRTQQSRESEARDLESDEDGSFIGKSKLRESPSELLRLSRIDHGWGSEVGTLRGEDDGTGGAKGLVAGAAAAAAAAAKDGGKGKTHARGSSYEQGDLGAAKLGMDELFVMSDERQMRISLRGTGHDVFRGK